MHLLRAGCRLLPLAYCSCRSVPLCSQPEIVAVRVTNAMVRVPAELHVSSKSIRIAFQPEVCLGPVKSTHLNLKHSNYAVRRLQAVMFRLGSCGHMLRISTSAARRDMCMSKMSASRFPQPFADRAPAFVPSMLAAADSRLAWRSSSCSNTPAQQQPTLQSHSRHASNRPPS